MRLQIEQGDFVRQVLDYGGLKVLSTEIGYVTSLRINDANEVTAVVAYPCGLQKEACAKELQTTEDTTPELLKLRDSTPLASTCEATGVHWPTYRGSPSLLRFLAKQRVQANNILQLYSLAFMTAAQRSKVTLLSTKKANLLQLPLGALGTVETWVFDNAGELRHAHIVFQCAEGARQCDARLKPHEFLATAVLQTLSEGLPLTQGLLTSQGGTDAISDRR